MSDDNNKFFEILSVRLKNTENEALHNFQIQKSSLISKAASNGNLNSGRMFVVVTQLLLNQIEIQRNCLVRILVETMESFEMESIQLDELKRFYTSIFTNQKEILLEDMMNNTPFKQSGWLPEDRLKKITSDQVVAVESFFNEKLNLITTDVELAFRKRNMSSKQTGTTFNVSGNIGIVQVGDNNVATINENHKTTILNSIKQIRENSNLIPNEQYTEIEPIMVECEAELNKEKPNKAKLGAYMGAIGKTIGGIAALGDAYQAIKMLSPILGGPNLP